MTPTVVEVYEMRFAKNAWDTSLSEYGGSAVATLMMSDDSIEQFAWYHDEVIYKWEDFMGKTMEEIHEMHSERDAAYFRS